MSKSQTGRKRATQAPSPTGQSETPSAPPPARQTEPLRVEPKSQTGRKRATQAPSPTGQSETPPAPPPARQTEPLRVEERGVPAFFSPRREDQRPSSEQIAIYAYHLWLARGRPVGTDRDDWLEAERRLAASA
jgi:Protein of unknown function (DUF2934)